MRKVALTFFAFGALLLPTASAPSTASGVARFREREVAHYVSPSTRLETWRTQVFLLHRSRLAGTGALVCVSVDTNTTVRECQGTYDLPLGRVQVAGEVIVRSSFELTIVGGTGIYEDARGVVQVSQYAPTPRRAFVTFYLQ